MEKGSFLSKNLPQNTDLIMTHELQNLPLEVARSKAVEALIQQNDDLMARLTVNTRRISILEEELSQTRQDKENLQAHYDNLKDQVLILKQKTQTLANRKDHNDNLVKALKDKAIKFEENLRISEIRYAELHRSFDEKQAQMLKRVDQHARRIKRYLSYRERIQKAAQSLRKKFEQELHDLRQNKAISEHNLSQELRDLKQRLNEEHATLQDRLVKEKIETENRLTEKIKTLQSENAHLDKLLKTTEISLKDLREKLAESTEYIQTSSKTHAEELAKLKSDHALWVQKIQKDNELELKESMESHKAIQDKLKNEIERLQREHQKLFDKCTELERVYEDNVELQNKIIFTERNRDEQKSKLQDEIEMLQRNLSHYRADSKSKTAELERLKLSYVDSENLVRTLKEDKLKIEDQLESTQSLWRDSQNEIEKLKEKNMALQKMNQQLSTTINQSRKEQHHIKEKFDNLSFQMSQKFKELKLNAETISSIRDIEQGSLPSDFTPELAGKIETLIAEIQSGFTKKM